MAALAKKDFVSKFRQSWHGGFCKSHPLIGYILSTFSLFFVHLFKINTRRTASKCHSYRMSALAGIPYTKIYLDFKWSFPLFCMKKFKLVCNGIFKI
jgi:hypothetical protein